MTGTRQLQARLGRSRAHPVDAANVDHVPARPLDPGLLVATVRLVIVRETDRLA